METSHVQDIMTHLLVKSYDAIAELEVTSGVLTNFKWQLHYSFICYGITAYL